MHTQAAGGGGGHTRCTVGCTALRVGGRECVFKVAESAHIGGETSRLRDALSVRHATPSAQALVLPHEDMDAPRPSVCRVDEDARRQRRATQEGWTSTWK